jgi:hypothetical protein
MPEQYIHGDQRIILLFGTKSNRQPKVLAQHFEREEQHTAESMKRNWSLCHLAFYLQLLDSI